MEGQKWIWSRNRTRGKGQFSYHRTILQIENTSPKIRESDKKDKGKKDNSNKPPKPPKHHPKPKPPKPAPKPKPKPTRSKPPPSLSLSLKVSHYGNKTTIKMSTSGSSSVVRASGNGYVPLVFSRSSKSAAPNIPTYISVICGNTSVYSGAFNTTQSGAFAKKIPYQGNCNIKIAVRKPSSRWNGTYNAVVVSHGKAKTLSGKGYTSKAKWKTVPVSSSKTFNMNAPSGFKGILALKLTSCSSANGASDATAKNACNGHVRKDVGSSGKVTIKNGSKTVYNGSYSVNYKKHHDTVSIPISKLKGKNLKITVTKKNGSSVLVHGTGGTSLVGAY